MFFAAAWFWLLGRGFAPGLLPLGRPLAANLFYTPIAGKLKRRTMIEVMNLEIIFEGAISIMGSCNPRLVHKKLSAFIPES